MYTSTIKWLSLIIIEQNKVYFVILLSLIKIKTLAKYVWR